MAAPFSESIYTIEFNTPQFLDNCIGEKSYLCSEKQKGVYNAKKKQIRFGL